MIDARTSPDSAESGLQAREEPGSERYGSGVEGSQWCEKLLGGQAERLLEINGSKSSSQSISSVCFYRDQAHPGGIYSAKI